MADHFAPPRDQHPACVASGCRCMPKAHCISLCVETVKMTLTPGAIGRIALNGMPACFGVTRELAVALAQKAQEFIELQPKLLFDTGKGCSVCGHTPVVNVSGTYWLCGSCVEERLHGPSMLADTRTPCPNGNKVELHGRCAACDCGKPSHTECCEFVVSMLRGPLRQPALADRVQELITENEARSNG